MKKIVALAVIFILCGPLMANECELESFSVNWTAFKTPTKIGVSGTFEKPNLESKKSKADCFLSTLPTSTVHIDTATIKTDNEQRDAAIVTSLFKNMVKGKYIDAIIKRIDIERKELSVEITMNDKTRTIYMPFTSVENTFSAKGKIDLLNFSASDALNALNEACFEKHKGKTWSEVEISFVMIMNRTCK